MPRLNEQGPFFKEWIILNRYKSIAEIGVATGRTTIELCKAAKHTGGCVYGFDIWEQHGLQKQYKQKGSKESVDKRLKKEGLNNFQLYKVDTTQPDFKKYLKKIGFFDFVFIDGCHSYSGVLNDFLSIYPLLSDTGTIAFHDTLRIDGCRELMLDLRTKYYDGTFDIINIPWGNEEDRVGISLLYKRSFHTVNIPINQICGAGSLTIEEIYEKEKQLYTQ